MHTKFNIINSLGIKVPRLIKEWNQLKNDILTPFDVTYQSNKKVWWICEKGHEWNAQINSRTVGRNCPYCANKKVCEDNCLAIVFPDISKEWHSTKNGNLTPYDVTYGCEKKVWWMCPNNHEYSMTICNRTSTMKQNCPICIGKTYFNLEEYNSELASEWNYEKNKDLTPKDVTLHSGKKVWWKCSNCGYEWEAKITSRTNGSGCPNCPSSKGEKVIKEYLNTHIILYYSQKTFKGLNGTGGGLLSYDFYLPKYNLLIEYQGEQHKHPVDFCGDGTEHAKYRFEVQKEHDNRKREYAKNNCIQLLEIWYWDFDNIENKLSILVGAYQCGYA